MIYVGLGAARHAVVRFVVAGVFLVRGPSLETAPLFFKARCGCAFHISDWLLVLSWC